MQWYYSKNGQRQGPVPQEELMAMVAGGTLKSDDLVWREGMTGWSAVASVPELASAGGPPPLPATTVVNPYMPPVSPVGSSYGERIPNYLWQSIVVTVLCCLPFGIPAIVHAAKVDGLANAGNIEAARKASDSAKMWCWIAFGLGLVFGLLYAGIMVAGIGVNSEVFQNVTRENVIRQ